MIQNNTSKINTLEDRGVEVGLLGSLSDARLKGPWLGGQFRGQFRGPSVERGRSLAPGRSLGFSPHLTI